MSTPPETYRRVRDCLAAGRYDRLPEVLGSDGYIACCVGLTGWAIGLDIAPALSDLSDAEEDVVHDGQTLVVRPADDPLLRRPPAPGPSVVTQGSEPSREP